MYLLLLLMIGDIMISAQVRQSDFKRVCCIENDGSNVENGIAIINAIQKHLCTHIIYYYSEVHKKTLDLEVLYPDQPPVETDLEETEFGYFVLTRNKMTNLKALLAIGSYDALIYKTIASSSANRAKFIANVIALLKRYNFDGLHLDLQYPICRRNTKCTEAPASDKSQYTTFVKVLRESLNKESPPLMLTSTLAAESDMVLGAYDVKSLSRYVDFFNVWTFDYYGTWSRKTGHHAQLFEMSGDTDPKLNIDYTMKRYLEAGIPSSKLVVGIPSYGRMLTLRDRNINGFNAPVHSSGVDEDMIAVHDICKRLKKGGWTIIYGNDKVGPYAYKGDQWISYMDVDAVEKVANYVKDNSLGGTMLFTLNQDDNEQSCCSIKLPVQTAVKTVLTGTGPSISKIKASC
ncbi:Uncharacterised protein g3229 [Pycnogonum litorale]